jgi:small-conductance mechanosensitive channel
MKEGKEASIVFFIMLVGVKLELKALFICLLLCKYTTELKKKQTLFTLFIHNSLIRTLIFVHLRKPPPIFQKKKTIIIIIAAGGVFSQSVNAKTPTPFIARCFDRGKK